MTRGWPDHGDAGQAAPIVAKPHSLTLDFATLQRLLSRRTGDGVLIQADPALIGTAIGVGYEEVRLIRKLLATIPDDPTAEWHPTVEALDAALMKLDTMLIALEALLAQHGG